MRDEHLFDGVSSLVLAANATPIAITGTLAETAHVTVQVPGGLLGPNGCVEVIAVWSWTNNANSKSPRIRFGGLAGAILMRSTGVSVSAGRFYGLTQNRGSQQSQVQWNNGASPFGTGGAAATSAIDTSVPQDIVISSQLANVGDVATLESYLVRILNARGGA